MIDDGSYVCEHMITNFVVLYNHVPDNSVYLAEDKHHNYWPEFGCGIGKEGRCVEFAKQKIDEFNAVHSRSAIKFVSFIVCIHSSCLYESIVVFEKRRQGFRQAPLTSGIFLPRDQ